MMVVLALFGVVNGYVTARYLKFFGNTDFKMSVAISALVLPLFIMGVFFVELGLAYIQKQPLRFSAAKTLARVIGWYLLNGAMCFIGAY